MHSSAPSADVVVVGGGVGGCVVARRLAEEGAKVVVVEAGPGFPLPSELRALDLNLHRPPERRWPPLTGRSAAPMARYVQGRGLGGSGALNGGVLAAPTGDELRRWTKTSGCTDWSPQVFEAAVRQALDRLGSICEPRSAADAALASRFSSLGPMSDANTLSGQSGSLLRPVLAASTSGSADGLTRVLTADRLLDYSGHLEILVGTPVDEIIVEDGTAGGVVLADGRVVRAEQVVLACGAIQTPVLMARSGLLSEGTLNAFDHGSVGISFRWPIEVSDVGRERQALVRMVGRWMPTPVAGNGLTPGEATLHVIGPFISDRQRLQPAFGMALVAPAVEAIRSIVVDGGRSNPVAVGPCHWDGPAAIRAAATVRAAMVELWETLSVAGGEPSVEGEAPDLGHHRFDDPGAVLAWMARHWGPTYHVAGTVHNAKVTDPGAIGSLATTRNLAVADASLLPGLPAIGPQLSVMAAAEVVAERLA